MRRRRFKPATIKEMSRRSRMEVWQLLRRRILSGDQTHSWRR
jgi:hypothetical protein